jgi:hypothetical protein
VNCLYLISGITRIKGYSMKANPPRAKSNSAKEMDNRCGKNSEGKYFNGPVRSMVSPEDWMECDICGCSGIVDDIRCDECSGSGWLNIRSKQ